jgi:hypothetical protein
MIIPTATDLLKLIQSGLLHKGNAERIIRIFYDAAKLIYHRQQRNGKSQLKMKEIAAALTLVEFHHSTAFHFPSIGSLSVNLGECSEDKAIKYYETHVMGEVLDSFGRRIVIDENGMKSLYKERGTGKHIVDPANYEEFRGKRLPWIRHTVANSKAVYVVDEIVQGKFRRTYLYTAIPSVPVAGKHVISYFLVVVSEDKNGNLRLVTAYDVLKYNRFLCYIEPGKPFTGRL